MTRTGAWLAVYALEQLGIEYTFGIPGVHNIELYDELGKSRQITPVLVTHEGSAAFMADAISRTTSKVGTLAIVPAAGMAHAMSGIGEAFLAGVPMLILSGGIRRDTGRHYQLHQLDQQRVLEGITKGAYLVTKHRQVVPTIFKAYQTAVSGEPGPVFVELPGEIQMFSEEVGPLPKYESTWTPPRPSPDLSRKAVELLRQAKHPGLYLGWGARRATKSATELAEMLEAPVSTTAQGLSVFPANHPLHTGMGFGPSAVPAARNAFEGCDCLLAVGVRFAELATGSYGLLVPPNLIHIDINPKVFGKNYPARLAIEADAAEALGALVSELKASGWKGSKDAGSLRATIKAEKEAFKRVWTEAHNDKAVSPGRFFAELRERLKDGAF
ncbi:MAG: thiamine pyrophosphate-binding protein, partial [Acidobacteriota bacterium]